MAIYKSHPCCVLGDRYTLIWRFCHTFRYTTTRRRAAGELWHILTVVPCPDMPLEYSRSSLKFIIMHLMFFLYTLKFFCAISVRVWDLLKCVVLIAPVIRPFSGLLCCTKRSHFQKHSLSRGVSARHLGWSLSTDLLDLFCHADCPALLYQTLRVNLE